MTGAAVLIVDDNPLNSKLMKILLLKNSYVVRTAANAEDALEVIKTFTPDLILMDIQLPDMDGFQLTRRLKRNPAMRDVVIVALTAYAMKGDEQRAVEAGCDGYIAKPIDTRTLPALISGYIRSRRGTHRKGGLSARE